VLKNWNPAERAKRLRNYRLFLRVSGPLFVLGAIMIIGGVAGVARQGSMPVVVLGIVLVAFSGLNILQVVRSTVRIVELDERDAPRPARPEWGGDTHAGS
jgi:hypothetical protein